MLNEINDNNNGKWVNESNDEFTIVLILKLSISS